MSGFGMKERNKGKERETGLAVADIDETEMTQSRPKLFLTKSGLKNYYGLPGDMKRGVLLSTSTFKKFPLFD